MERKSQHSDSCAQAQGLAGGCIRMYRGCGVICDGGSLLGRVQLTRLLPKHNCTKVGACGQCGYAAAQPALPSDTDSNAWRVFAFLFCEGTLDVKQAKGARRASSACEVDSDG